MGFAPTWLRQVTPSLLHKTTLTTDDGTILFLANNYVYTCSLYTQTTTCFLHCGSFNGFVDDALRGAGSCVNEALLQVNCVTDRRLVQTLLHQAPNAVIDCSSN